MLADFPTLIRATHAPLGKRGRRPRCSVKRIAPGVPRPASPALHSPPCAVGGLTPLTHDPIGGCGHGSAPWVCWGSVYPHPGVSDVNHLY